MKWPTVLIGGGYDKQEHRREWIEAFDGKVKLLVLIGQTREKDRGSAQKKHGMENIVLADSFEEAMDTYVKAACPGDAVLLSPHARAGECSPNYEVRGKMFKEYVNSLKG